MDEEVAALVVDNADGTGGSAGHRYCYVDASGTITKVELFTELPPVWKIWRFGDYIGSHYDEDAQSP